MKLNKWFKELLDKEELEHFTVSKAVIHLQLKNDYNGNIELHEFEYIHKKAENLVISE